jgi:hypothetical protein
MRIRHALLGLLVATPAFAGKHHTPGVQEDELKRSSEIQSSVAAGDLLPFTTGARHHRQGLLFNTYGGYDDAKRAPVMQGVLDATLVERVTFRVTSTNTGMSDQLKFGFGALVDVIRAEDHGVDLAVGGDYELLGWNRMPAAVARTALGGNVGQLRLQGNAGFGLGLEGGDRYGDLRLSGLHPVTDRWYAGIDSRARIDLASTDPMDQAEAPSGKLDYDIQAGPVATYTYGRIAVSATGGVSAWKLRSGETAKVGAAGAIGLGAAF